VTAWTEQTRAELSHVEIMPLERLQQLPEAGEFDGGIYFLWLGDQLQYVGKSNQISIRLNHHHYAYKFGRLRTSRSKRIPFDRHTSIVLFDETNKSNKLEWLMRDTERAYIAHYEPPFNSLEQNPGT